MIEQLLIKAEIQQEINIQQDGNVYTFSCEKVAMLDKLRYYFHLMDYQNLVQICYLSDIQNQPGELPTFTVILDDPRQNQ
uniref:Uncharacterized protein n=1 Tax=Roseihalotalea indica TaxID=2867963 RepID=A0AA49GRI4_9BACT|nr:hypothetical protein K4G66_32140 [Tunicatimonas sp. TK19036]